MYKLQRIQKIFFIICTLTMIYYFILNYSHPFSPLTTQDDPEVWKEYIWIAFYFTSLSNLAITIMFGFKVFAKKRILKSKKFIFFEFLALESIAWTGFAYCVLLSYFAISDLFKFELSTFFRVAFLINTTMVHLIVPLMALYNFIYERVKIRKQEKTKQNTFLYAFLLLASPLGYLLLNLSIYFSFGAGENDNVYPFMAVVQNDWDFSIFALSLTFSICYLINLTTVGINNRFAIEKEVVKSKKA